MLDMGLIQVAISGNKEDDPGPESFVCIILLPVFGNHGTFLVVYLAITPVGDLEAIYLNSPVRLNEARLPLLLEIWTGHLGKL